MKRSLRAPEFLTVMNREELIRYTAEGIGLVVLFGYFFYRSVTATLILLPAVIPYLMYKAKEVSKRKKRELMLEFKDMLGSLDGSLQAGYSIENAFDEAYRDMKQLYGEGAGIVRELGIIKSGMDNNYDLAGLLEDFAVRSHIEEIESFADILSVGMRAGGNLSKNMETYVRIIDEKTEVLQEIDTMISARRFEQRIMNAVPFLLIFYVELSNRGFFSVLYHNLLGNIVMTVTMAIYLLSVRMSDKMTDITV